MRASFIKAMARKKKDFSNCILVAFDQGKFCKTNPELDGSFLHKAGVKSSSVRDETILLHGKMFLSRFPLLTIYCLMASVETDGTVLVT